MTDFIDGLEHDLVAAARRQAAAQPAGARRRRRLRPGRGLAVGLVSLVLAGSATAAVVGLTATPSKPLAGPVRDSAPSARAYAVSLLPDLGAGQAGWCSLVRMSSGGRFTGAGMGCGPARAAGGAQIAGGGFFGDRGSLQYAVVTAKTRAVRFDDHTVVATRSDPSLPYGWRYAVAITGPSPALRPSAVGIPPQPSHAPTTTAPAPTSTPSTPEPFVPVALDANGKALPATTPADGNMRQGRSRPVTTARPARHCVIGSAAGYVAGYARVAVSRPTTAPRLEGRAFASCAKTVFHTEPSRGGLSTAILLDAQDPGRRAAPLPRTPGLSGRRLGPGWIVVFGGEAADRRRLLARLRPRL